MIFRQNKRKVLVSFAALILIAASLLAVTSVIHKKEGLKTYRVENGWGYTISKGGKVIIDQPVIPGLDGRKPFKTRRDAAKTGKMVIKKLQQGIMPTITREELKKAGIIT